MEEHKSASDSIYPEANEGRLKTTDAPVHEEEKIISKNVKGSEDYERFEHNLREAKSIDLDDRLVGRAVFCTVGIAAIGFTDYLYGRFIPIVDYVFKGTVALLFAFLVYYLIYQLKISADERRYKKRNK